MEDGDLSLKVRLRFRDGTELRIDASRLATLFPGFVFHFPAVESDRVYRILQAYCITRELFTYPVSRQPIPGQEEALLNIIGNVGVDEDGVDALGHLARAAISLGAVDLKDMCVARLQDLPITPQIEFLLHQINAIANPIP